MRVLMKMSCACVRGNAHKVCRLATQMAGNTSNTSNFPKTQANKGKQNWVDSGRS